VVAVPVSGGGTRLVTVSGTKVGHVVSGNRVLLTTNRTHQQQLQQKQQQQRQLQLQKQKQQIGSIGQDATVTTSNDEGQLFVSKNYLCNSCFCKYKVKGRNLKIQMVPLFLKIIALISV
jgi:hypothetical protein